MIDAGQKCLFLAALTDFWFPFFWGGPSFSSLLLFGWTMYHVNLSYTFRVKNGDIIS